MEHNNQTYHLLYNHQGSLGAVADINGIIVKELQYDAFGNITLDTNSALHVDFGFAGGLYDSDTGLTRFGYRDYQAETGKWTAKDPIGFEGGDSNLYGYVLGDPVNFVDPEGLWVPQALGLGALGYGAYKMWERYKNLAEQSQQYCTDENLSDLEYWTEYHKNMNKLMPEYQDATGDIWQTQFGNTGKGLGGKR